MTISNGVIKVVYKLLIEYKIQPQKPVATEPFELSLNIRNIGESTFPGGLLTLLRVFTANYSQTASNSSLQKIKPLKPNESTMLKPHLFTMIEGGVASVNVEAKSNDGDKIDLFQSPEHNLGTRWHNLFRIESIEQKQIIDLLEKIAQLLESRKKE